MTGDRHSWRPMQQRGIALAVILILLLIITLLGLAAMTSSSLLWDITHNRQTQFRSFQNAEATLREAETNWSDEIDVCLTDFDACTIDLRAPMIDLSSFDWTPTAAITVHDVPAHNAQWVVEYLGFRPVPGEGAKTMRLYRFTVRAGGHSAPSSGASTRIQSLLKKCITRDGAACAG